MRTWIRKTALVAALAISVVGRADEPGHIVGGEDAVIVEDRVTPMPGFGGFTLTPEGGRFSVRGWFNGGYIYNSDNPNSRFNGPYNSVYNDEAMFNQAYLIAEYLLPQDGRFGVGGRVDAIYGQDFLLAQSVGMEKHQDGSKYWNGSLYYGVALPQAYAQIGTNDTNLKVGHFYSIVGYEGVQAAGNMFYSKSYSYQFAGPFTHWGLLGSHQATDNLQILGGAHLGWDTLDRVQDHVSFIGGYKYVGCEKNWWSSFMITTGQDPTNLAGNPQVANGFSNRTRYSFIIDANLTDRIEYVFHHWLGFQVDGAPGRGDPALWYGIDQYAYYKIDDCWKFGARFEWFRDEDGTRVGLTLPANPNRAPLPGTYYSGTVGFNYSPVANLVIRPEARYDWATDTAVRPYNDGLRTSQFMLGVDAILKY